MINKNENEIQMNRGEFLDQKEKRKFIPDEIKVLNSLVNEIRKHKAEKMYVDEIVQKMEIMKSETLKLSGLQEEMNKNNELKDDVDAIKIRVQNMHKSVLDKMDKSEKESIMLIIKEKAQTARQNHTEFTTYKKKTEYELNKIEKLNDRMDGLGGKNASKEEFLRFKDTFNEFRDQNDEEFNSLRQ